MILREPVQVRIVRPFARYRALGAVVELDDAEAIWRAIDDGSAQLVNPEDRGRVVAALYQGARRGSGLMPLPGGRQMFVR